MQSAHKDEDSKERIAKVNRICKAILKLTPEDFEAVELMAEEQLSYSHPLKHGTAGKITDLGLHNKRVAASLRELQKGIQSLKK